MNKQWSDEALDRALTDLHRAPVPEGFGPDWRAAVRREERTQMKKKSAFWRVALPVAAALVLVIGTLATGDWSALDAATPAPAPKLAASGASRSASGSESYAAKNSLMMSAETSDMAYDAAYDMGTGNASDASAVVSGYDTTERKLVRAASLTLYTSDFDADGAAVRALCETLGGYVESLDEYSYSGGTRVVEYALRVPGEKLDAFLEGASAIGRVGARGETATDMSTQYADTALRLQTQRDKLARLQELMARAENVTDLLEIENAVADAQYQIDAYESALRSIDRRVDDSEVTVRVIEETADEAAQATERTLGERISSGLAASVQAVGQFLQNLAVFLVMCLPVLVPLAVVGAIVALVVRRRRAKRTKDE